MIHPMNPVHPVPGRLHRRRLQARARTRSRRIPGPNPQIAHLNLHGPAVREKPPRRRNEDVKSSGGLMICCLRPAISFLRQTSSSPIKTRSAYICPRHLSRSTMLTNHDIAEDSSFRMKESLNRRSCENWMEVQRRSFLWTTIDAGSRENIKVSTHYLFESGCFHYSKLSMINRIYLSQIM